MAILLILLVNLLHSKHFIGFMIRIVFFFISCIRMVTTAISKSIYNLATSKIQRTTLSPNSIKLGYVFENKQFVLNHLTKIIKQITTKQIDCDIYPDNVRYPDVIPVCSFLQE